MTEEEKMKIMTDKFAPERYCDQCEKTVSVVFRDKTVPVHVYGKEVQITYKASYCSICGQAVCERDFDDALRSYLDGQNGLFPKEEADGA